MEQPAKTVLLVDDESQFLEVISDRIELMGMTSRRARSARRPSTSWKSIRSTWPLWI